MEMNATKARSLGGKLYMSLNKGVNSDRPRFTIFLILGSIATFILFVTARLLTYRTTWASVSHSSPKDITVQPTWTSTVSSFVAQATSIPDANDNPIAQPYISDWHGSPNAVMNEWSASPRGTPLKSPFFKLNDRVAVILEPRYLPSLVPLILHFSMVLGPTWPIVFITTRNTAVRYQKSKLPAPFLTAIASGLIKVMPLEEGVELSTVDDREAFLTTTWFWSQTLPAQHLLLFSSDSILCSNSAHKLEDFFDYDFVGAPLASSSLKGDSKFGYEGGLSLRNATLGQKIVVENDALKDWEGVPASNRSENQWFMNKIITNGGRLASYSVAGSFATGDLWNSEAFGYVRVGELDEKKKMDMSRWCPEFRLASLDEVEANSTATTYAAKHDGEMGEAAGTNMTTTGGDSGMPHPP